MYAVSTKLDRCLTSIKDLSVTYMGPYVHPCKVKYGPTFLGYIPALPGPYFKAFQPFECVYFLHAQLFIILISAVRDAIKINKCQR